MADSALDRLGELPPWLRYLAVALCERHVERTELRLIIETQVEEETRRGDVPGRPGWTFFRTYGRNLMIDGGICSVELDLDDDDEDISIAYVACLVQPIAEASLVTPAMQALRAWIASPNLALWAADDLASRGVVEKRGTQSFVLTDALRAAVEAPLSFSDSATYEELAAPSNPSDDEGLRDEWLAWLADAALDPAMPLLAELHENFDDEDTADMIRQLLDQPLGRATAAALATARRRDLDVPRRPIERLVGAMRPTNDDARAMATFLVASVALEQDVLRDEVIEHLVAFSDDAEEQSVPGFQTDGEGEDNLLEALGGMTMGVPMLGEVATLLLEHAPERSATAVRRAIRRDSTPHLMAARLVAIGQPWAIREVVTAIPDVWNPMFRQIFVEVLRDAGFEEATLEARKKLQENVDPLFETDGPQSLYEAELQSAMMQMAPPAAAFAEWAERIRAGLPADFALEEPASDDD